MMDDTLRKALDKEGYFLIKEIPGRGVCGIMKFMFTTAIVYGIDRVGYTGRYCYPHSAVKELTLAYQVWDGVGDPIGPWIKHKGVSEYSNPNLIKDV